jgi:hypothetical protein
MLDNKLVRPSIENHIKINWAKKKKPSYLATIVGFTDVVNISLGSVMIPA